MQDVMRRPRISNNDDVWLPHTSTFPNKAITK